MEERRTKGKVSSRDLSKSTWLRTNGGEMLVVKDRHERFALLENTDNLLVEPPNADSSLPFEIGYDNARVLTPGQQRPRKFFPWPES